MGLKRIGIALSLHNNTPFPYDCVLRKNRNQAAKDVSDILLEWEIEKLVVGIPKGGKSSDEMKRRIEHFVGLLAFDKEIIYVDEYGSSDEAKSKMQGVVKQKRDGKIDSIAACIILERYFFSLLST